jgi:protoporphyrinogen oxidase
MNSKSYECCILGAGPAGLAVALELTKHGVTDIVIIDRNKIVGGLSRTEVFDGARFDIGPHRFFTKNKEIDKIWHNTLGVDFKPVSRFTRIYYKDKYFNYPIKPFNILSKLDLLESLHVMFSFAASKIREQNKPLTFEEWVTQKFGRKLYESFFKTYTEKVWGIPCSQISAEWAAQRIKGLDIIKLLRNSLLGGVGEKVKTLAEEFKYPILGAGQMYETMCDKVVLAGAETMLNSQVISFNRKNDVIESIDVKNSDAEQVRITAKQFFNSSPLTHFFKMLNPPESDEIQQAVEELYYRDHITVNLLVGGNNLFPDQWIYVHSPQVQMARLTNYNNFSKTMAGNKNKTALSVEYFVFQHEEMWKKSDNFLKSLAIDELRDLGLIEKSMVDKSWVVRETESYPTYYLGFDKYYNLLKSRLNQFNNLYSIGRAGMYKYNNQDHSMISGILAARNYLKLPGAPYNLWDINIDAEYLEE